MNRFRLNFVVCFVAASVLMFACKDDKNGKLTVSPAELNFTADDDTEKNVIVDANGKWKTIESTDWIFVSPGEDRFTVTVDKNTNLTAGRTGTITVIAGKAQQVVTVNQSAAPVNTLSLSGNSSLVFGEDEADTKSVVVITSAASGWNHSAPPVWLKLEKKGATLEVTPKNLNFGNQPRSVEITISAFSAPSVTLTVTQEKTVPAFNTCEAVYYGDDYGKGTANFELFLYTLPNTNQYLNYLHIEGFSTLPSNPANYKLDGGTYQLAQNMAKQTFLGGDIADGYLVGTFYYDRNTPRHVLVKDGTFTVALIDDIYTITTNFTGVIAGTGEEVNVRYKYTGPISFFDESGEPLGGITSGNYVATAVPSWFTSPGPKTWKGTITPNTIQENYQIKGFSQIDWMTYNLKYVDGAILLDDVTRTNVVSSQNPNNVGYMRVFCELPEGFVYFKQGLDYWEFYYDEEEGILGFDLYLPDEKDPDILYPILIGLAMCDAKGEILGLFTDLYTDLKFELTPAVKSSQKFGGMGLKRKSISASSDMRAKSSTSRTKKMITFDKSKMIMIPKDQVKFLDVKDFQPIK